MIDGMERNEEREDVPLWSGRCEFSHMKGAMVSIDNLFAHSKSKTGAVDAVCYVKPGRPVGRKTVPCQSRCTGC